MEPPKKEEPQIMTDNQKIAMLANLELAIQSGKFEAIYLLSEDATIVQKEEDPNHIIDWDSLRSTLINAIKVAPQFSEFVLTYQDRRVVVRPLKTLAVKGGSASIPGVSFIALSLPLTKAYRKDINEFVRNLLIPFIKIREKPKAKKNGLDEEAKKRLAQKVLDDLDKI